MQVNIRNKKITDITDLDGMLTFIQQHLSKHAIAITDKARPKYEQLISTTPTILKSDLIKFARATSFAGCKSVKNPQFWTDRGYTAAQAADKVVQYQKQASASAPHDAFKNPANRPCCVEYWTKRGHNVQQATILAEQSKVESSNRRPEFWVKHHGMTTEQAKQHVSDRQRTISMVFADDINQNPEKYHDRTNTQIGYWTNKKGMTEQQARRAISKVQRRFSLDICIAKYGEVLGVTRWQERQDKWTSSLYDKPQSEIADMVRRRTAMSGVSKQETKLLEHLGLDHTHAQQPLKRPDNRHYIFDIMVGDKIIEYNGDFWHMNPEIYQPADVHTITGITAEHKWVLDNRKIQFAREAGYQVLVVWESQFLDDFDRLLTQCQQFLTK